MQDEMPQSGETSPADFEALRDVIAALQTVGREAQARILTAAATFLNLESVRSRSSSSVLTAAPSTSPTHQYPFSADTSMSPKDFFLEKRPHTDVERVACLAYYLTHYRDMPHFKTIDLSKLNTEAAQPKFANAANAAANSVKTGYLVASAKGQRQISAAGEQFVQALPDRDAAREVMAAIRRRRRPRRTKSTVAKPSN
jgi:hypothetical protein